MMLAFLQVRKVYANPWTMNFLREGACVTSVSLAPVLVSALYLWNQPVLNKVPCTYWALSWYFMGEMNEQNLEFL